MKFKIKEHVETEKEIELEIPYYFKHIKEDYKIYGAVLEDKVVHVTHYREHDSINFTLDIDFNIEKELPYIIRWEKSNSEEFFAAQDKLKANFA